MFVWLRVASYATPEESTYTCVDATIRLSRGKSAYGQSHKLDPQGCDPWRGPEPVWGPMEVGSLNPVSFEKQ